MQLPDLVQKQHPAVGPAHRAGLGLGHPRHAQRPRALVDGVVHTADERVGNRPFVKPHAGGIHLDEGRVGLEGRPGALLRRLQRQPRRAGFADAGRAVDDHMLRVMSAQDRQQRPDALLLADDVLKPVGPHVLAQRFRQGNPPHPAQFFHFPGAFPPVPGLGLPLPLELRVKVNAHHRRRQQLHRSKNPTQMFLPPCSLPLSCHAGGKTMQEKPA